METHPRVINFPTEAGVEQACERLKQVTSICSFKILNFILQSGETYVNDISDACLIEQSAVSHHLSRLKRRKLVKSRRDGKNVHYSCVNPDAIKTILETALKL
jgi:DNA-binding transcriptional ArsR family regulator